MPITFWFTSLYLFIGSTVQISRCLTKQEFCDREWKPGRPWSALFNIQKSIKMPKSKYKKTNKENLVDLAPFNKKISFR